MKCKLCGSSDIQIKMDRYPGFIEKSFYTIYSCNYCNTNYISDDETDKSLYEKIYSSSFEIEGYDKYYTQSKKIKSCKNPLEYLASESAIYYSVKKFLKRQPKSSLLEVGCGYGYLTYALVKEGFNAKGIDISEQAIKSAITNYGDYYSTDTLKHLINEKEKYDLIISTEVIEHVDNPCGFISDCAALLTPNGKLFLTTPNKDFCKPNAIWFTDLPPVHKYWFSIKSFGVIAEKIGMNYLQQTFVGYFPKSDNRFVRYFRFQNEVIQKHVIDENYKPFHERIKYEEKGLRGFVKYILLRIPVIRFVFNLIYNLTIEKDTTMAVVFWKK